MRRRLGFVSIELPLSAVGLLAASAFAPAEFDAAGPKITHGCQSPDAPVPYSSLDLTPNRGGTPDSRDGSRRGPGGAEPRFNVRPQELQLEPVIRRFACSFLWRE